MVRNINCTSFEIEIPVRERMREVARLNEVNMKEWLLTKIEEGERELGIVVREG